MGKEVVYCFRCGQRLLEEAFLQRKAVELSNRSACLECAKEALGALSTEERSKLDEALAPASEPPPPKPMTPSGVRRTAAATPRPGKIPTSRIPTKRHVAGHPRSGSPMPLLVGAVALIGLVVGVVAISSSGSGPRRAAPPAAEVASPVPPPEAPPRAAPPERREVEPPSSPPPVPLPPPTRVDFAAEEERVDRSARNLAGLERLSYLETERRRFEDSTWTSRLDAKLEAARREIRADFDRAAGEAKAHASAGRFADARAALDRFGGVPFLSEPLREALAAVDAAALAAVAPEARKAMDDAFRAASGAAMMRNYARALELWGEPASPALADEHVAVRRTLERAGAFYDAARESLRGKEAEVSYHEGGKLRSVRGTIAHVDDRVLHLREAKTPSLPDSKVVPLSIVDTAVFAAAGPAGEDRASFLAAEGLVSRARLEWAGLNARFMERAKAWPDGAVLKLGATPEFKAREQEAARLWREAEKTHRKDPSAAAGDLKKLLDLYADTSTVESKRKQIEKMLGWGRELVLDASELKGATSGWKAFQGGPEGVKGGLILDKDIDPKREGKKWVDTEWIDFQVEAIAGTRYRFYFYVGSCCDQTGIVALQGEKMTAHAPQSSDPVSIGGNISNSLFPQRSLPAHGAHGAPTHWMWMQSSPMTFSESGRRTVRLFPGARGFVVSHVVMSSAKYIDAPPPPPARLER